MALFFVALMGVLLFQIYFWQSFAGDAYAVRAMNQVLTRHGVGDTITLPNRGRITDRNMQNLAVSSTVYNIFVDVRMLHYRMDTEYQRELPGTSQYRRFITRDNNRGIFTGFFGWTNAEFEEMMAIDRQTGNLVNNTHYFVIERAAPFSRRIEFENWIAESGFFTRDIHFEPQTQRNYLHHHIAAPVIGFQRDLWWGLENYFNSFLAGYAGRNMAMFGLEGNIVTDRIPPIHGANVITTLDLNFQRFAEDLVVRWAEMAQAGHASINVMCPHTGEILAMAQYPGFDANNPACIDSLTATCPIFLSTLDPASDEFVEHMFRIWANFNISNTFEPGSIYKSFTSAKALEEGLISPDHMFYCGGFVYRGGFRIRCWTYPRGQGRLNLTQAIAQSCNVAHIEIAEMLGRQAFWQYQRDFGFGTITGIDLPGENPGMVFAPAELNATELATSSFGQRFTATPIQAIAAYAPLINGGHVVRPHVVSRITDNDGNTVFAHDIGVQRSVISPEVSNWMRHAMAETVISGTARSAAIEGFTQGGKTGTAEQGLQDDPNFSWSISYVGYFPVENPQFLISVVLHQIPTAVYDAGFRSVVPMYREMMQEIIRLRNIPPCYGIEAAATTDGNIIIDNFVGMHVRPATHILSGQNFDFQLTGSGNMVVSQFPPAGVRASSDTFVVLHLEDDGSEALIFVPDLVGQSSEFAAEVLTQSGFFHRIRRNYPSYENGHFIVHSQTAPGLFLPENTTILLTVR
ncbi:MAG: penicillin-binding transpeptidase domain-containing protein [Defluviitaleaceae bacterium]|nr:penicillin-binding transpeptidase domain-containing protein [Defluviitaleaceae bacterium]